MELLKIFDKARKDRPVINLHRLAITGCIVIRTIGLSAVFVRGWRLLEYRSLARQGNILLFWLDGLGILIYLILCIVLPEAKTTAQKIEMKGNPVNIHNIKDSVKQEFEPVRKKMNI